MDYEKERAEAIDAGRYALDCLNSAYDELNKAGGWGIVDLLGGGLFTNLIKHSKMNRASDYISDAKDALTKFSKELKDISSQIDLDFNTADFLSFADFFFDGFIADWLVQSRIDDAKHQISDAICKVEEILKNL